MIKGYWERQLTRRRLLKGVAATGAGVAALSLLSCGGDGGDGGDGQVKQEGLIFEPEDTTQQAKRGGIYADVAEGDETNLDPFTTARGAGQGGFERPAYQKILREKEFAGGTKTQVFEGDAAESFELSDGGLKLVAKLRPNNKFDSRSPTNGRTMNAQDVVYSWDKMVAGSTYASIIAHKKDPAVPVESVQAIDDRTVVYKMAFPWAALLAAFAEGGPHQIAPVEAEDKFNLKNTVRGSGPWTLEIEPSVVFRWRRNPGYYRSDVPLLEGYDQPILPEYATRLAQFNAKRIWNISPNPRDIPATVQESPGVRVYRGAMATNFAHMWFSGRPTTPFRDVRLRRAASMAIDRPLYAEVISEADFLRANGLPLQLIINNNIPGGAPDFWLDPTGKEMGEAAKYFTFNQAEAKKLIAAAGYPNGLDVLAKVSTLRHGTGKASEITLQMLREVGIRAKHEPVDYNTIFLPLILSARGDWEGDISFSNGPMGFSPVTGLQRVHHPAGGTTRYSCFSQPCSEEHRKIAELIEKALKEIDPESYRSQVHDLQREIGKEQGAIVYDFSTAPLTVVWPWVKNWEAFRLARQGTGLLHVWIDETLKS